MHCLDESLLQMLVEGTLEGPETDLVRIHLGACSACRKKIAEYKQLMWDLQHPQEPDLPGEMEELHATLMAAWNEQQTEERQSRQSSRSLIPSWAGYSVQWARHVPPVDFVGGVISRAGNRLLGSVLPMRRRRKPKGGERR